MSSKSQNPSSSQPASMASPSSSSDATQIDPKSLMDIDGRTGKRTFDAANLRPHDAAVDGAPGAREEEGGAHATTLLLASSSSPPPSQPSLWGFNSGGPQEIVVVDAFRSMVETTRDVSFKSGRRQGAALFCASMVIKEILVLLETNQEDSGGAMDLIHDVVFRGLRGAGFFARPPLPPSKQQEPMQPQPLPLPAERQEPQPLPLPPPAKRQDPMQQPPPPPRGSPPADGGKASQPSLGGKGPSEPAKLPLPHPPRKTPQPQQRRTATGSLGGPVPPSSAPPPGLAPSRSTAPQSQSGRHKRSAEEGRGQGGGMRHWSGREASLGFCACVCVCVSLCVCVCVCVCVYCHD